MSPARILILLLAFAAPLAAAPVGLATGEAAAGPGSLFRPPIVSRGIVQSVSAVAVVLKQLDGTTVTVGVDSSTLVHVNGQPATLADVHPGAVAAAFRRRRGPALELRVFESSRQARLVVDYGVVQSVSATSVVLRRADGTTVVITVGPATRVILNGKPATFAAIQPRMSLAARHRGSHPELALRARGGKTR